MAVKILVADDSAILRATILKFLRNYPEIELVADAQNLNEAAAKCQETSPDVIVLDLHMAREYIRSKQWEFAFGTAKVLAITLGAEDFEAQELARSTRADKLLDKMNLTDQLVPSILELVAATAKTNACPGRT